MLFEMRSGNKVYFTTTARECVPKEALLRSMIAQGYKPFLNGQRYTLGEAKRKKQSR